MKKLDDIVEKLKSLLDVEDEELPGSVSQLQKQLELNNQALVSMQSGVNTKRNLLMFYQASENISLKDQLEQLEATRSVSRHQAQRSRKLTVMKELAQRLKTREEALSSSTAKQQSAIEEARKCKERMEESNRKAKELEKTIADLNAQQATTNRDLREVKEELKDWQCRQKDGERTIADLKSQLENAKRESEVRKYGS